MKLSTCSTETNVEENKVNILQQNCSSTQIDLLFWGKQSFFCSKNVVPCIVVEMECGKVSLHNDPTSTADLSSSTKGN